MSFDWQTVCALIAVTAAVLVLVRRIVTFARSPEKTSCGNCPSKSAPQVIKTLPLVQIDKVARIKRN